MRATHHLLRVSAVAFGTLSALLAAVALTALAMWVLDQSPDNWGELGAAVVLGTLAAGCALAHHSARSASLRWPRAMMRGGETG
jgi:peptidoglycan/LPS O-acetylase OafA/YrhL